MLIPVPHPTIVLEAARPAAARLAMLVAAADPPLASDEKQALARVAPYCLLAVLALILAACVVTFLSEKAVARLPDWMLMVIIAVTMVLVVFELVTQTIFLALAALFGTVLAGVVFIMRVLGPFVAHVMDRVGRGGRGAAPEEDGVSGAASAEQAESRRRGAELDHTLAGLRAEHDDAAGGGAASR